MVSFREFNRVTTDYADVLNILFKDFIQFTALQYKGKLIAKKDATYLIDSHSHNDLVKTLKKYREPLWSNSEIKDGDKFSLINLKARIDYLKYRNPNSSLINFIEAQQIGPKRINIISSVAQSLFELRNKIAHGEYVQNEAQAAIYWSNLAQLIMSYPPVFIKKEEIKQKFNEMDEFIKGDLLQSWVSFYQPEDEINDSNNGANANQKKGDIDIGEDSDSVKNIIQSTMGDLLGALEKQNSEILQKLGEIQNNDGNQILHQESDDDVTEQDHVKPTTTSEDVEEILTEQEARSELKQLKNRIHSEMKLKWKEDMANWECILQWALIDQILESPTSDRDNFKNSDTFQRYYTSSQSKYANANSISEAKRIMDLQLDIYWDDIKKIVERTQTF